MFANSRIKLKKTKFEYLPAIACAQAQQAGRNPKQIRNPNDRNSKLLDFELPS